MTMSLVDRDELSQRESVLLEPTPLVNEDRHFDLGGNKSSTAKGKVDHDDYSIVILYRGQNTFSHSCFR